MVDIMDLNKIHNIMGREADPTDSRAPAAYSSDREQRFHAMVNGAWGWQLESEFLRQVFTIRQGIA